MVFSRTVGFSLAVITAMGLALPCALVPAQAQDLPAVTVAGGLVRVVDEDVTLDGFFVEGEHRVSPRFSIVGQAHRATTSNGGSFSMIDWTDLFAGGGLRFTMRPHRVVQPHVHALAGMYRVSSDVRVANPRPGFSPTLSNVDRYAAFVFGAGLNVMPSPRIGFRAGFDLQVLPGALPTGRLTAGVVVPIGRR
jgi:hypothetical protein